MKILLRSLIAVPLIAVLSPGAPSVATAVKRASHDATQTTALESIGFLDLKTFLIGPAASDDPALASERLRIISPETLLYDQARIPIPDPLTDYGGLLSSVASKRTPPPDEGFDSMTIEVNGAPVTLSLGLRDAMLRDLQENIRVLGVSGLFGPAPGAVSVGFIGKSASDVTRQIDALEDLARTGALPLGARAAAEAGNSRAAPSSLPVFAVGLLAIVWLRRSRLFSSARAAA